MKYYLVNLSLASLGIAWLGFLFFLGYAVIHFIVKLW